MNFKLMLLFIEKLKLSENETLSSFSEILEFLHHLIVLTFTSKHFFFWEDIARVPDRNLVVVLFVFTQDEMFGELSI